MPWLQLTFNTDREGAPLLEAALENAGALAVTLVDAADESRFEPAPGAMPLWSRMRVTALFPDEAQAAERAHRLAGSLADRLATPPSVKRLDDRHWERAWLDGFSATRFGKRLWICPRGHAAGDANAVVVELDPGLAFGTGHHPTTALCLRWLDGADLRGRRLIDYGCGSGILAIAALRLGAAQAIAVDHDPQALEATRANAHENRVSDRLLVRAAVDPRRFVTDFLVANILARPLVRLAPELASFLRPGGHIALSGILRDQAEQVSTAYRAWFDLDEPRTEDDWVLLSGRRRPHP